MQTQVLAIIDDLVRSRGMGLILISHNLHLVSSFCDRVLVMYAGQVVETCAAAHLADAVRARLRHEIGEVFGRFDAILAPIAAVTAFPHDHRPFNRRRLLSTDGALPYPSMLNWISLATALHLPATAIPAGPAACGLPVGVQLIGPLNGDSKTLALAQAIEENVRGFTAPVAAP